MNPLIQKQLAELGILNHVESELAIAQAKLKTKFNDDEISLYVMGFISCLALFVDEKKKRMGID